MSELIGSIPQDAVIESAANVSEEIVSTAETGGEIVGRIPDGNTLQVEIIATGPVGKPGTPGTDGYTPVRGIDYYTQEDKTTIVEEVVAEVGTSTTFVHDQYTPEASWFITHSLNRYPAVTVIDTAGTNIIGDVVYVSNEAVRIDFSAAFSGRAFLN